MSFCYAQQRFGAIQAESKQHILLRFWSLFNWLFQRVSLISLTYLMGFAEELLFSCSS